MEDEEEDESLLVREATMLETKSDLEEGSFVWVLKVKKFDKSQRSQTMGTFHSLLLSDLPLAANLLQSFK